MIRAALLILLGIFLAGAWRIINHLGAFREVIWTETTSPHFVLLGLEHEGAYHKIVPTIEKVEKWASAKGFPCRVTFGLYLDNPKVTEENRLRSKGGCVLTEMEASNIAKTLAFKIGETGEIIDQRQLIFEDWIPRPVLRAQFDGSPGIGPFKVYSPARDWAAKNNRDLLPPTLEVYEIHSAAEKTPTEMSTTYYFPLGPKGE